MSNFELISENGRLTAISQTWHYWSTFSAMLEQYAHELRTASRKPYELVRSNLLV